MKISDIAIRHPVFTCMISVFILVFGLLSFFTIGVQETPNVTYPVLTVKAHLLNANPELVDQSLAKPMESILNTLSGVKHITTISTEGTAVIEIQFMLGKNMSEAFNETKTKLNQIRDQLPLGMTPPIITEAKQGESPIIVLSLFGDRTVLELNQIAQSLIIPKLENISGVSSVMLEGGGKSAVCINVNLNRMTDLHISPQEIEEALGNEHIQEPGGIIDSGKKEYTLNLDLQFHEISELEKMIVAYRDGAAITLGDISTIAEGNADQGSFSSFNGQPNIGISIIKRSQANTVSITKVVNQRLKEEVIPLLSPGITLKPIYEVATYILKIVHSLQSDIFFSIIATAFVVWLFLRNFRSTFIIVLSIPISLLGVVMIMHLIHYTFNIVTLLGMILLVGIVVDDSIVVLESIYKQIEQGIHSEEAASKGAANVVFAVLASSLTLSCIFIPVIFMQNIIGLFFKSFGVIVSSGVLLSLFISLTLTPMCCSRFLSLEKHSQKKVYSFLKSGFESIDKTYHRWLHFSLRCRWLIVLAAMIMVAITVPIFNHLGKNLLLPTSNPTFFYITVTTPEGSGLEYTKTRIKKVEDILKKYPEITGYFSTVSHFNEGEITVGLPPLSKQNMSEDKLINLISEQLKNIPGIQAYVGVNRQSGTMTFSLLGEAYKPTLAQAKILYEALKKEPVLGKSYLNVPLEKPGYYVDFKRPLANSLGISAYQLAEAMIVLGGGKKIGKFNQPNLLEQEPILLRAEADQFQSADDISLLSLPGISGEPVRLDTIAKLTTKSSVTQITQQDMNYSIPLSSTPSIPLNQAIALVEEIAEKTVPYQYHLVMTGDTESAEDGNGILLSTLGLILILIYAVLASQFDSFIQPFIILVAQPLALIGGILALWLTHQVINLYSMIGMLLLMGLVAKNSILLIDLTNTLRAEGKSIKEALLNACCCRMRPVLMTSLTIIFAMIPTLISTDPGNDMHRSLSLVIVGGMISSTLLTLLVVPALYSLVENALLRVQTPSKFLKND